MRVRSVAIALSLTSTLFGVVHAEPVKPRAATPIRDSVARLSLDVVSPSRVQSTAPRDSGRTVRRAVVASLLGFAGFIAGGNIGARIAGDCGGCDDPGLTGALIGAPIGAVAGAIVGWKIAR